MKKAWTRLETLFESESVFVRALWYVPVFYFFMEFMAVNQLAAIEAVESTQLAWSWIISWLWLVPQGPENASLIFLLMLFAGLTIGAISYQRRISRIIVFLVILQFQSFRIALVGSEHEFYIPLFVSFVYIFLPDVWRTTPSLATRKKFLVLYWGAMGYVASVYFMSGAIKVIGAAAQISDGLVSYFSFDAAALYVASILNLFDRTSVLGPFIVDHPLLGWCGLMLMLYVLLGSLWALFVPELHRLWGFGLVLFHISTLLAINIVFYHFPFFAALFFIGSPFAPVKSHWRDVVRKLPLFGLIISRFVRGSEGIAPRIAV